ncbi:hypothetical protein PSACC_02329 [Paramicrosporidium saccamoebae]|uniref:Uncharacterized protein n=1 Tax=Paramicrosporidium saccamoebae TaxID=1246581 RepID=A0A2H9TJD8_9FUNG|nr:hypothetical protein PSACC_02329 [Paramicrosporidium saccamoebae]
MAYHESSDDEAPEAVSLSTSKSAFLTQLKSSSTATASATNEARARRRAHDAKLKEQATLRASRVAAAIQQLAPKERSRKETIQPTRRIFKEASETEEEEDERVVLIGSRRVARVNLEAARKQRQSREELLMLHNKRTRVHASVSQAPSRSGRPATKFVVPVAERDRLMKRNRNTDVECAILGKTSCEAVIGVVLIDPQVESSLSFGTSSVSLGGASDASRPDVMNQGRHTFSYSSWRTYSWPVTKKDDISSRCRCSRSEYSSLSMSITPHG